MVRRPVLVRRCLIPSRRGYGPSLLGSHQHHTNQPKPMEPITKRFGPTDPAFRHPQRICATVSWHVAQALQQRADAEGRSVSNLVAYELERSMLERRC